MREKHVTVTVHGADAPGRARIMGHLGRAAGITVADGLPDGEPDLTAPHGSRVAVLLADTLDDREAARLRRLARRGDQRVVLVVRELAESELVAVVECGVHAVVRQGEATPEALVEAVRSTARGEGVLPPDLISRLLREMARLRAAEEAARPGGPGRPGE